MVPVGAGERDRSDDAAGRRRAWGVVRAGRSLERVVQMSDLARRIVCLAAAACAAQAAWAQKPEERVRSGLDPGFRPKLVRVDFTSRRVRPGDPVAITFTFRNDGVQPAKDNYWVFLHFEYPKPTCDDIRFSADHLPVVPTTMWEPGKEVVDGPRNVRVPAEAAEGSYRVHVGVYVRGPGGGRLLDAGAGRLEVTKTAPPAEEIRPTPLSANVLAERRARLAHRLRRPTVLETETFRFAIDGTLGAFELTDKRAGVTWTSDPEEESLGNVELTDGRVIRNAPLTHMKAVHAGVGLQLEAALTVAGRPTGLTLHVAVEPVTDPLGLRFRERVTGVSEWRVRSVRLLDHAFGVTDADKGYAVVPFRLGELLPTDEGLPAQRSYLTYSGTAMALYGAVKQGAALLVSWPHPDTRLDVFTTWPNHPLVPGSRMHTMSLTLLAPADEFTVYPVGRGGYVELAKAYRKVARRRGWVKTWAEKRRRFPSVDQMFGAADFKPFVFGRTVPGSRFNATGKDQTHVGYTFSEAAQVAEHLHRALGIDRALYVLAGWIHRGYDNQHPDILPACPECGGNEALADCAQRVKACGFLFGLHDNYQDMYEDAPSWDVKYLNKTADGKPKRGGNWAGGQAWQVCAVEQVKLAERPQNLPAVAGLFGPTVYFIDTVFAWPLVTCADPHHPMTRSDDLKWKSRLCDVAKKHFGLFGSEEGREWAVPHADYLEGLLSHKVRAGGNKEGCSRGQSGIVIPFFELVYGDCVNLYTHQGDRAASGRSKYILDCLVYGENALYRFGPHLYYTDSAAQGPLPVTVKVLDFEPLGPRRFQATYQWKATKPVTGDPVCFVHFTHPDGDKRREHIAFQNDHRLPRPVNEWRPNEPVLDGPHVIEVPEKYHGDIQWLIGLTENGRRLPLSGLSSSGGRHHLGVLKVTEKGITFQPSAKSPAPWIFARADNGWARGLGGTDRFIKNTYEVLSWVNRLTAETPMTDHRFLTPDRRVEYSAFGPVRVWVNYGPQPWTLTAVRDDLTRLTGSPTVLPADGFVVLSPTFVAFHATAFDGVAYSPSACYTARSLDGKPLWQSHHVRVYHAFGPGNLRVAGRVLPDSPR